MERPSLDVICRAEPARPIANDPTTDFGSSAIQADEYSRLQGRDMKRWHSIWILSFVATLFYVCPMITRAQDETTAASSLPKSIEFNRDVRPILSGNCFFCHGPDKNKRQADLRLDTQEGILGNDGHVGVVVPGKPEESELFRRVTASDEDERMPPKETGKSLSPATIELLKRWIEQGGQFEGHWAFLPIRSPIAIDSVQPGVAESAEIDRLIERSLADHHLQFSREADRITLIRRLSFDLIGLPPTEKEVADFVADDSPQAYERVVDRLLGSTQFGERLAMWWLDLVRYADSVGYHGDQPVSVYPFRQYVIDSFNANKPFDQFTIEQLAGDLLPNPTLEQRIASGYNRLGMMSAEGGVQDKEYLAKYIAERVRNVSGTWLGITLGCAECHDHKFDPFPTRDFYRFEAFFADIKERGLYAGANDDGNWGPSIKIPSAEQAADLASIDQQIAAVKKVLDTTTPELAQAQSDWEKTQIAWTTLTPDSMTSASGTQLTTRADGAILATGKNPDVDTYQLSFSHLPAGVTGFRLVALPDDSLPSKGPGRAGNGNFVLTEFSVAVNQGESGEEPVGLSHATATHEQADASPENPYGKWAIEAAIDGDTRGAKWGWAILDKSGQPNAAVVETSSDLTLGDGKTLTVTLAQNHDSPGHNLGCFRLFATTSPRPLTATQELPQNLAAIIATKPDERTSEQNEQLAAHYRTIAPELDGARKELADLEKNRKELDAAIPTTLVTESVAPAKFESSSEGIGWMKPARS